MVRVSDHRRCHPPFRHLFAHLRQAFEHPLMNIALHSLSGHRSAYTTMASDARQRLLNVIGDAW
jgi:hypothetical protein